MTDATPPSDVETASGKPPNPPMRSVKSADLLQGAREVQIDHEGEIYRLRLTRNGKLILFK